MTPPESRWIESAEHPSSAQDHGATIHGQTQIFQRYYQAIQKPQRSSYKSPGLSVKLDAGRPLTVLALGRFNQPPNECHHGQSEVLASSTCKQHHECGQCDLNHLVRNPCNFCLIELISAIVFFNQLRLDSRRVRRHNTRSAQKTDAEGEESS